MGNQLLKGYTIQGEPISAMGCQKMWRTYQGQKHSTHALATIFAIEKKALPKSEREDIIQFAKKQAMGLTRIRHPGVLAISETLIEDQNIMAFSTEQIQGNLTTLSKDGRLKQIVSNEIELRLSLFPLLDTIQFLHDNVKNVHLGLNFDNIYITKEGKWKVSGFSNSQVHSGDGLEDLKGFRCSNYYFCGPQIVQQKKFQKKSDVYALGIVILDLLLVLNGKYETKTYRSESEYSQLFEKDLLKKINHEALEKLENYRQLKNLLKNIFSRDPSKRASMQQLISSKWLNDKLVLTVRYLQNITNYDNKQQIEFLKGLMGILNNFDSKILSRKVLPLLLDLLKFKHLIPSVIYICLEIMKNGKIISESEFKDKIWPSLRKVVQGKEMTAHSLFLFVQNIQKIEKVIGMHELTTCIVPLYVKCFDCPAKLKELALYKTDYILSKMDYQFVKTKMIPKVMNCMKDQSSDIHKKSLIALKKSIKILDVQTITSIVLPGLQTSRKASGDPFVNSITVAIYTMLGKTLPAEALSSKLIPTLLPFLSDPNVGPQDFYQYKNALMTMIQKIQSERKKFWDESQATQGPTFTEKDFEFEDESKKNVTVQSNIGKGDYNFLSNYNQDKSQSQQQQNLNHNYNMNQVQPQTQPQYKKQQSDQFQFSSPFSVIQQPKMQNHYQSQNQSQNQKQNQNLQQQQQTFYQQQHQQQPQQFQQYHNTQQKQYYQQNTNSNDIFNGNLGFTQMGSIQTPKPTQVQQNYGSNNFDFGNNWGQVATPSQPFSSQTKQTFPKLKGPGQVSPNKIRQPEHSQNDPWMNISLNQPTSNNYSYSNTNSNKVINNNNINHSNYATNFGYQNNNQNKPISNQGMGFDMGMSMGSKNSNFDDPFAEIEQSNKIDNTFSYGTNNANMNMGNLYGGNNTSGNNNNMGLSGYGNNTMNMNSGTGNMMGDLSGMGNSQFNGFGGQGQKSSNSGNSFDLI